jgi:hypothetical protein
MKVADIKGRLASVGIILVLVLGYLAFKTGLHVAGLSRETTVLSVSAFIIFLLLLVLARGLLFPRD